MNPRSADPAPLRTFARAFEHGEYFLAHEILEGFWVGYDGRDREFFQGLVQAAVALHHASRGNLNGARGVARSCRRRMGPFAPRHRGLEVDSFLSGLDDAVEGRAGLPSLAGWEYA